MDFQQLPAIKGESGFEYKISVIHLSTRFKYSEIHSEATSKLAAEVLERAVDKLPPFYVVFTDNGMQFTMKYAYHKNRKTTFTKWVEQTGRIHALIPKGKPWKNGFIERSNRTDKENLFNKMQFTCSEHRKYMLSLWEYEYNYKRPHQGIGNKKPAQIFKERYPFDSYKVGIT
jgi:transposase InsO family protein